MANGFGPPQSSFGPPGGTSSTVYTDPYYKLRQLQRFGAAARDVMQGLEQRRMNKAFGVLDRVRTGELEWDSAEVSNALNKVKNAKTKEYLRKSLVAIRDTELPAMRGRDMMQAITDAETAQQHIIQAGQGLSPMMGGSPMGPMGEKMMLQFMDDPITRATLAASMGEGSPSQNWQDIAAAFPEFGVYRRNLMGERARQDEYTKGVLARQEDEEPNLSTDYQTAMKMYEGLGFQGDELKAKVAKYMEVKADTRLSPAERKRARIARKNAATSAAGAVTSARSAETARRRETRLAEGGGEEKVEPFKAIPKAVRTALSERFEEDAGKHHAGAKRLMNRLIKEQGYTQQEAIDAYLAFLDREFS